MSNITIDVKNDAMLGRMNDGVIATKLYSLEKKIEDLQHQLEQKENIIKEVREYFENHTFDYDDLMLIKPSDVLEILDKVD